MKKTSASKAATKTIKVLCLTVFILGAIYSAISIYQSDTKLTLHHVAPLIFVTLSALHFASLRFQFSARIYHHEVPYLEAVKVVAYSAIANLLPIPGAAAVRFQYLQKRIGPRNSLIVQLLSFFIWFSIGFSLLATIATGSLQKLSLMLALMLCAAIIGIWRFFDLKITKILSLTFIQTLLSLVSVIKIWLILLTIGHISDFDLPIALTVTNIIASSSSVAPGGIGIAESLSSLAAAYLESPPSIGFAAIAINRAITWPIFFLVLIIFKSTPNEN
jgi:hypothetical protein